MTGDQASRLAALVERCERDAAAVEAAREEGDALAEAVGGDPALRWRIAVVRALIAAPPDGDAVREAYGELVDRYRDVPDRLARVRPLGDEILVARSDRRPRG